MKAENINEALAAIEKFGHFSQYSQVDIKLTFSGESFRNSIDFSIEAFDEWGNAIHIGSDIIHGDIQTTILEIARVLEMKKTQPEG